MDELEYKERINVLKYLDIIAYMFLMNMSFYLVLKLNTSADFFNQNANTYLWLSTIATLLEIIFFYIYGLFSLYKKSLKDSIYSLGLSIILINLLTWIFTLFDRNFIYSGSIFLYSAIFQFFILGLWIAFSWNMQKRFNLAINVLVVGEEKNVSNIIEKMLNQKNKTFNIKYICSNIAILEDYLNEVDEVIICPKTSEEEKKYIINKCIDLDKKVNIIPQVYDIVMSNSSLEKFDDMPVFKIEPFKVSLEKRVIKRIFDIIISSVAIIILSPIMLIVAIIIKIYDRGPITYKQARITKDNKEFNLYKFRTMIVDAEKVTGPVLATDKDPRITPVGRILRSTRIDELPQFFNVFKGDMSIVGPRPERAYFIKEFTKEIPEFKYRVTVKAGITGLAQVLGKYTTTPEDKLRYDLMYIKNYSLFLDFKILIQTVKIIFMKESSQGVVKNRKKEELFKKMDIEGLENSGIVKF